MSDLGPAIVTGSVAIVIAVAGFISTGTQARRTQRAQDRASLRNEKRQAYVNCLVALNRYNDISAMSRRAVALNPDDPQVKEQAERDSWMAETDVTIAGSALTLVAPGNVQTLVWDAALAIGRAGQPGHDKAAADHAVIIVLAAMRADLGYPPD